MSKAISLKVKDDIFETLEHITKTMGTPRNKYINDALDFYNQYSQRKQLKQLLIKESKAVYHTSMEVLKEFESLESDIDE